MKDRKVTVEQSKWNKKLIDCTLTGEAKFKGNKQLFMFGLTLNEAIDLKNGLELELNKQWRDKFK